MIDWDWYDEIVLDIINQYYEDDDVDIFRIFDQTDPDQTLDKQ